MKLTGHSKQRHKVRKMSLPIVMILIVVSLLDPIYSKALKADSENTSKTKVPLTAERRGGGEFFDSTGYSLGYQGHGYRQRTPLMGSAALVRPKMARYSYFDPKARAMVRVEVEPMVQGRTEHADNGYGTVSSPVYTYAAGYGPSYTASDYGSSVPSDGMYGASYTVQDTNPYGYQDTAASEYIVSGSSDPYGMYGNQGYPYQGGYTYSDPSYPGTYDSAMQSTDPQTSGYSAAHGDGSYDRSQQMAASGVDPSNSASTYDGTSSSGTASGSTSSSYRNNDYKRNGSQGNNDQLKPSRTFFKR